MSKSTSSTRTKRWLAVHRIAGLIVSLNLLVVSATGILLIFHDEIGVLLGEAPEGIEGGESLPIADLLAHARAARPGENAIWIYQDPDEHPGLVYVGMNRGSRSFDGDTQIVLRRDTGALVPTPAFDDTFVGVVYHLHVELLAGPIGRLLVGIVGVAFLVVLVSGFVVYGPMMRRFRFGTLRAAKQRRTFFADVHKLLGAATFGWNLVVAFTGVLLELSGPLFQYYSATEIAEFARPYASARIDDDSSTIDAAIASTLAGQPGKDWSFISLPGSPFASPVHYAILFEGGEGLESKLQSIALVDAATPTNVHRRELPVYLRALMLAEPLHFGDYGGLVLEIVWTVFSLITIAMASTGVYVFFASRKNKDSRDTEPSSEPDPETVLS